MEALRGRAQREAAARGANAVILTVKDGSGIAAETTAANGVNLFGYVGKLQAQFIVWQ